MRLHDSLSRHITNLPAPPAHVGIYVCGITPYDSPHLGHARAAVVFDALVRWLKHRGYPVTYVRNATDIDDKIIARAASAGAPDALAFTVPFLEEYARMCATLGCLLPDHEPRVSHHIPEIIALVERLIDSDKAYAAAGSVYFSVRSFPGYGSLSGRNVDDMREGAGVHLGEEKRDPLDFALWKAAKPGEPRWESPWGPGRPGWHIECSAMAMKYLGETFEIHGGGHDLLFPHHENERAQSEAATGKTFALIWMHNGLVTLGDRKMSKSDGNVLGVPELLECYGATILRYYLLAVHYGSPLDASPERFVEAKAALDRFHTLSYDPSEKERSIENPRVTALVADFTAALDDNFNTPRAFAVLFDAVKEANKSKDAVRAQVTAEVAAAIDQCGRFLGLELLPEAEVDAEIDRLVEERTKARQSRDFARADVLRKELAERGVIIEDMPTGTRWRR